VNVGRIAAGDYCTQCGAVSLAVESMLVKNLFENRWGIGFPMEDFASFPSVLAELLRLTFHRRGVESVARK
jgi:hypothetical protein